MRPSETSRCGRGRRKPSSRVCLETQKDKGISPECSTTGANRRYSVQITTTTKEDGWTNGWVLWPLSLLLLLSSSCSLDAQRGLIEREMLRLLRVQSTRVRSIPTGGRSSETLLALQNNGQNFFQTCPTIKLDRRQRCRRRRRQRAGRQANWENDANRCLSQ